MCANVHRELIQAAHLPLPIPSDRQLGRLGSGDGKLRGTRRAQETAAVFPDTHTVVLQSGGSAAGSHRRSVPDHPGQIKKDYRKQPSPMAF